MSMIEVGLAKVGGKSHSAVQGGTALGCSTTSPRLNCCFPVAKQRGIFNGYAERAISELRNEHIRHKCYESSREKNR